MNYKVNIAKELLDLSLSFELKSPFPYATMGLWYLRNEDIDESVSEEKGKMYYQKAVNMSENYNNLKEDWTKVLLQKYNYELAIFYLNRKNNKKKAKEFCLQAYNIGKVEIMESMYKAVKALMKELNISKANLEIAASKE